MQSEGESAGVRPGRRTSDPLIPFENTDNGGPGLRRATVVLKGPGGVGGTGGKVLIRGEGGRANLKTNSASEEESVCTSRRFLRASKH